MPVQTPKKVLQPSPGKQNLSKPVHVKGVRTQFTLNNITYGSYVIAPDVQKAERLIGKRGLYEEITEGLQVLNKKSLLPRFSTWTDEQLCQNPALLLQSFTYLGTLAIKAKKLEDRQLLAPTGIYSLIFDQLARIQINESQNLYLTVDYNGLREALAILEGSVIGMYIEEPKVVMPVVEEEEIEEQ